MSTCSPPAAWMRTPVANSKSSTPFQLPNDESGTGTDGELEARPLAGNRIDRDVLVEDHPLAVPARTLILLLQRAQYALGRDRELGHPRADRVVHGGGDRRRLRVVRHLADPFRAVRAVRGRVLEDDRVDLRQPLDPGGEVRAELRAAVLGTGVVRVALLEHPEAEAHERAALDLALDQRRVDRPADVEALPEVLDRHLAGLVVDLDLRGAGGVRDGRVGRKVDLAGLRLDDGGVRVQLGAGARDELTMRPG